MSAATPWAFVIPRLPHIAALMRALLRTDLLRAQAQVRAAACDMVARRANHQNPVDPLAQKYSA